MRLRRCGFLTLVVVVVAKSAWAQQTIDISSVVSQFYPQTLADFATIAGSGTTRAQCYGVLENDTQGNPRTVLAAYTNLDAGAIRVLQGSGGVFTVVAEPAGQLFAGEHCSVEIIDVDGDGKLDAHVSFSA